MTPQQFSASGIASTSGTLTLTLPQQGPPNGQVLTGSVSVPGSPPGAVWTPIIGPGGAGFPYHQVQGASALPVQLQAGDQVTLSGAGLTPGASYTAVLFGQLTAMADAPPSPTIPAMAPATASSPAIIVGAYPLSNQVTAPTTGAPLVDGVSGQQVIVYALETSLRVTAGTGGWFAANAYIICAYYAGERLCESQAGAPTSGVGTNSKALTFPGGLALPVGQGLQCELDNEGTLGSGQYASYTAYVAFVAAGTV